MAIDGDTGAAATGSADGTVGQRRLTASSRRPLHLIVALSCHRIAFFQFQSCGIATPQDPCWIGFRFPSASVHIFSSLLGGLSGAAWGQRISEHPQASSSILKHPQASSGESWRIRGEWLDCYRYYCCYYYLDWESLQVLPIHAANQ